MTLPNAHTEIKHVGNLPVVLIKLDRRMEVLSSAVFNGGTVITDTAIIIQVPSDYDCSSPENDIKRVVKELNLPSDTIGFMTAAEVEYVLSKESNDYKGIDTMSISTAGLSNQVIAGDELTNWDERHKLSQKRREALIKHAGTINIIGIVPDPLTNSAKVNAIIAMTEAKTAALNDLGYKETGTTSDAIAIMSPTEGDRQDYCGTGLGLGISLARSVRSAVRKSLIKRGDFPVTMTESEIEELRRRFS